jgi:BTB/POZ domain
MPSFFYPQQEITSFSGMGTETVDIYVGPSKKRFRLYKTNLCARIPYFDKMFNGNFKEASENVAYLTEDDPASFDLLADWANHPMTSKSPRSIRELTTTKLKDGKEVASWDPVGFYSLAEKYCLPELQDIIMDALIQHHKVQNELPSVGFVVRAYKHTSTGSPLTKYCAEGIFFVMERVALDARWPTEDVAHLFQELPTFASEYITVQRKRGGSNAMNSPDPRDASPCYFHTHGAGKPCAGNPKKRKDPESERWGGKKRHLFGDVSPDGGQDFDFDSFLHGG